MKRTGVLSVGVINMTTGQTMYDWSIYENKEMWAFLTSAGFLLLGRQGTFEKDDSFYLVNNDTGRKLSKWGEILDASPCNSVDLLKMLKEHDYDYYPIRAFRSRSKDNRKLLTSYSVKSVE